MAESILMEKEIAILKSDYANKMLEVRRLKHSISAMKRDAYFDGKYASPMAYHSAVANHKNAVLELEAIHKSIRKAQIGPKGDGTLQFPIEFIRTAREVLDKDLFEKIERITEDRIGRVS